MRVSDQVKIAMELSAQAAATSQAYGVLLESLLGVLKDNNIINQTKLDLLFRGAAATVDQAQPVNDAQRAAQRAMRDVVARVAKGAGIDIPAPGQTNMPRKH